MKRQRNMSPVKEQKKTPEKELKKMETSNPFDAEFKTLVIRVHKEVRGRADELSENFNNIRKDMETIKKKAVRNEGFTT